MVRGLLTVLFGLVLAVLVAAAAGVVSGLPLLQSTPDHEAPVFRLVKSAWPMLQFAWPMAFAAIAAAEARHWRSWVYWGLVGVAIGICGYWAFRSMGTAVSPAITAARAPVSFAVMGLLGGLAYWWVAGRNAGAVSAALQRFLSPGQSSEKGDRQRCALCAAMGLLLGLVPLALLGWHAIHKSTPPLANVISAKAEADADRMLKAAGLTSLKFSIDDRPDHGHIGHVSGSVADNAAKIKAFNQARTVLSPIVGMPGVIAVLQNNILAIDESDPQVAAENARIREAQEAARSLAAEAAEMRKADEARRTAVEADARRKADEEVAKKKAEDEARLAAEAEAKRKADEEAAKKLAEDETRVAAEADAKRQADEEAAKKKAEDEARLAAEADAKRQADEEAAKKKAEDEARVVAEADAKRKADEEAASSGGTSWTTGRGMDDATIARMNCVGEYGQLFSSEALRFALRSAALESQHGTFLDKLGNLAKRCDGIGILIEGNADAWGAEEYNQALSEQRAEAVRAALVERGVSSKQLATRGFGELRPLRTDRTREADAANRRVDFGVIEIEKIPQTIVPKDATPSNN